MVRELYLNKTYVKKSGLEILQNSFPFFGHYAL